MGNAIHDGVSDRGIADILVPAVHGDLAGDDGGAALVTILGEFEEIAPLGIVKLYLLPYESGLTL